VFSLWWLYFAKSAHRFLTSNKESFVWGYGHYFIFAAVAAMGAGLAVNVDFLTNHAAISQAVAGATVTIPVAVFLILLWALHIRPHEEVGLAYAVSFLAAATLILAVTFSPSPVLLTGLITAALAGIIMFLMAREHKLSRHAQL
jgi:low temperature requirement protein LtrA